MLQALSDFFLLLSKDKKSITNKDLGIFYNFITKKMPQIEQQYPTLILESLEISSILSSSTNDKKTKDVKETKDTKKIFVYFQKQILNLYNELIEYCYKEGIIKISNKCEQNIKKKIEEKIQKNAQKSNNNNNNNNNPSNSNSEINNNYGNLYLKEISIKKLKKEEMRNFLSFLIMNDELDFSITTHNFVNFFNLENKKKTRNTTLRFVKFVKSLIKIYKIDKKNTKNKRKKKNINNNNPNNGSIKNNTNNTNNNTNSNNNNNNNSKINNTTSNNNTNKTNSIKVKKEKTKTEKIQKYSNKNSVNNNIFNDYKIIKKKYNTEKKTSDDEEEDDENDTLRCQTPKNISSENNDNNTDNNKNQFDIENSDNFSNRNINNKSNNSKNINNDNNCKSKLSDDFKYSKKEKKYMRDNKNFYKYSNRGTVSSISYSKQNKLIYDDLVSNNINNNNSEEYQPLKRYSYYRSQKKNLFDRNKDKDPLKSDSKLLIHHNSITTDKKNKKISNAKKQAMINKNKTEDDYNDKEEESKMVDKIKTIDNISNIKSNRFRIKKKIEHITADLSDIDNSVGYNVVNTIGINKKNVKFKESYLYKNSEVHQHMVIYNDEDEKRPNDSDEDNIGCNII